MQTSFQDKIVSNILKLLKDKDISQAELSRRTEIDPSTISKIISGETQLKVNALSKISMAIDVPVVDIITYPEKYARMGTADPEPVEAILQIRLKKDKKDQVLKLVFGDNNIEILNR